MLPAGYPTGWDDRFDEALAAGPKAGRPRRVAFWLLAFVFAATMLGTTLPTPLYDIYQAQWHFSAAMVTVIFAVYAAGGAGRPAAGGRSSDQAGRKPVLAVALGVSALSTVVFILAPDVGVLLAGRVLSGLSAGLMTGTATAALTELVPASAGRRASLVATAANMGGLGLGPLIAGLFAQYAPHPTTLVFEVYLAVLAAAGLCLLFVPETVSPRQPACPALRRPGHTRAGPGRVHRRRGGRVRRLLPARAVRPRWCPRFIGASCTSRATPCRAPSYSVSSRWGPSPSSRLSRFSSRRVVLAGLGLFLAALALIVAALAQAGMALFLAGTVVGRGGRRRHLPGQPGHGQPPGPGRAARSCRLRLLRGVLRGLIIPVVGVGVASEFIGDLRGRARVLGPARRPVPVRPGQASPRPSRRTGR